MKFLYEARIPPRFSAFIWVSALLSFAIVFSITYIFSGGWIYPLLWGGITALGSLLYCLYVMKCVIAPRVEGFRISEKKVYLPKRVAENLGRSAYPISEIKSIHFTGNYLMIEFKDRKIAPILTFEREKVERILTVSETRGGE